LLEVQLAQLDPTLVAAPLSPLLRALKTDISRRSFLPPHSGHVKPLPLLPTRQRHSITCSHFSQRNSYRGIQPSSHTTHTQPSELTIASAHRGCQSERAGLLDGTFGVAARGPGWYNSNCCAIEPGRQARCDWPSCSRLGAAQDHRKEGSSYSRLRDYVHRGPNALRFRRREHPGASS
jgi:hypothetical protein